VELATKVVDESGSLPRVGAAPTEKVPSAYLTYWASRTLLSAQSELLLSKSGNEKVAGALSQIARWSEHELSRLIANHHSGLLSRFDVVECISSACTVARLRLSQSPHLIDEAARLSRYGIGLVMESYFESGSFKLSRPVFSDQKHNAILCPTTEALTMILSCFSRQEKLEIFGADNLEKLIEAFDWCIRNTRENAYPPDFDVSLGGGSVANIFSTSSSLSFFKLFHELLDDLVDGYARNELSVSSSPPKEPPLKVYPAQFSESVLGKVIRPLTTSGQRNLAKYSMILHGPPGTAKTTLAKKIAFDLGWPLKIITQSDFLRLGRDKIDAEAERVFSLCARLKDTVILFDELEELILAREEQSSGEGSQGSDPTSRMLTTSMLPRIHELRDRERSVFIFATNRLVRVDSAATRLGRFDIIHFVDLNRPGFTGDL